MTTTAPLDPTAATPAPPPPVPMAPAPPPPPAPGPVGASDAGPTGWADDSQGIPPWRDVVVPPAPPAATGPVAEPRQAGRLRFSTSALVITALLASGAGAAVAWTAGTQRVDDAEAASSHAISEARASGYDAGYDSGLDAGRSEASEQYDKGHDAGYDEGYAKGTTEGYQDGYGDGAAARPTPTASESPTSSSSEQASSPEQASSSEWASGSVRVDELTYGTTDSDSVSHLQWALQELGYDVVIDGDYLDQTDEVVRAWQSSIGNTPDAAGESSVGRVQAERLFGPYSGITVS